MHVSRRSTVNSRLREHERPRPQQRAHARWRFDGPPRRSAAARAPWGSPTHTTRRSSSPPPGEHEIARRVRLGDRRQIRADPNGRGFPCVRMSANCGRARRPDQPNPSGSGRSSHASTASLIARAPWLPPKTSNTVGDVRSADPRPSRCRSGLGPRVRRRFDRVPGVEQQPCARRDAGARSPRDSRDTPRGRTGQTTARSSPG